MQEDFKVSITGDVSGLKKAVGDAEKELSAFASKSRELKSAIAENIAISRGYDQAINELKKSFRSGAISQTQFKEALIRLKRDEKETAIETNKLKNELIDLNRAGAGLAKSTPQMGNALGAVDKTSSRATNTMMEFSRVVQDAPYGIRGVANNIQQLVGNFGYLQKSTGSAGAAFKAMASSLMGPAGILLAVSLVTSLLVQYGDALWKSIKGTEDAKAANDRLNDALREQLGLRKLLKDEIDVATRIAVAEAKLAGKNEEQQYAVKKKFSEANIAILESEYKEATKRYRAFHNKNMNLKSRGEDEITELVDESRKGQLDIQKELNDAKAQLYLDDLSEQIRIREKAKKDIEKIEPRRAIGEFDANLFNKLQAEDKKAYDKRQKLLNDFLAEKEKKEIDAADDLMNLTFQKSTERLRLDAAGNLKELMLYDKYIELKKDKILSFEDWKKTIQGIGFDTEISKMTSLMSELKKVIPSDLFGSLVGFSLQQLQQLDAKLKETQVVSDVFNNAVSSGFQALGNQISTSLETGNAILDALVSSLISSLTSIATALITQAITEKLIASQVIATNSAKSNANGITIATSAAAAMGPAGIIALPLLLTSTAAIINSAFAGVAAVGAFAGGGIVPGGSFNGDKVPAFVNSGEMILNAGQQSNLFDILDGNLRKLGGQQRMQTIRVEGSLRGQTMLLQNKRSERDSNRFYGRK